MSIKSSELNFMRAIFLNMLTTAELPVNRSMPDRQPELNAYFLIERLP